MAMMKTKKKTQETEGVTEREETTTRKGVIIKGGGGGGGGDTRGLHQHRGGGRDTRGLHQHSQQWKQQNMRGRGRQERERNVHLIETHIKEEETKHYFTYIILSYFNIYE